MSFPSGISYAFPGATPVYVAYTSYPTTVSSPSIITPQGVSIMSVPPYSISGVPAAAGGGFTYVTSPPGVVSASYTMPGGASSATVPVLPVGASGPATSPSALASSSSSSGLNSVSVSAETSSSGSTSPVSAGGVKSVESDKIDPTLKATEKSKDTLKKVMDWVKALLDPETEMLWINFLEFDEKVEGTLDREELKKMLQFFDSNASENDIAEYMKSILRGGDNSVSFPELLDWWEKQKSAEGSRGSGVGLRSMLMARFAGQKLKSWSWDLISKSTVEKRTDELYEYQIQNSLNQYSMIIVEIRRRKLEVEDRKLDVEEDSLNKKFGDYLGQESKDDASKNGEISLDDYDRFVLLKLFQFYADKTKNLLPQKHLADIGNCINADFPGSILRMTSQKYPDPMEESDFLKWCNARGVDAASSLTTKNLSKAALNRFNVFK